VTAASETHSPGDIRSFVVCNLGPPSGRWEMGRGSGRGPRRQVEFHLHIRSQIRGVGRHRRSPKPKTLMQPECRAQPGIRQQHQALGPRARACSRHASTSRRPSPSPCAAGATASLSSSSTPS
jgi:hypothetical protein